MNIKKWVHLIFWSLIIVPTFVESLFNSGKYKNTGYFIIGLVSYLLLMFLAFYPISEFLAPRLVRNLKNWKLWLLLGLHIVFMALFNMLMEYLLSTYAMKEPQKLPGFQDYFWGMFWFVFIASSLYIVLEWYELQLQQTRLRQFLAQTELEKKRFQLNPHFLFNIFNSMYALSIKKSDALPEIILKLSELMRYILDNQNLTITIADEIKIIEHYLELERMRLGKYCDIHFEKIVDDPNEKIPSMLLLPLVENCFKHGINTLTESNYVKITLRLQNGELYFRTENLRWKNLSQVVEKESKLGIENLRQRLEMLYPPKDYALQIEDNEETFVVQMHVKLSKHEVYSH